MCGIVGYIGPRDTVPVLLVGLERLSYRGYDSAGIAVITDQELTCWKKKGKLHNLSDSLKSLNIESGIGIGHTRWATHGSANELNAHPHVCPDQKVAVVHNGIIENYLSLQKKLIEEGRIIRSQTDTEVIVHLISQQIENGLTLESAVTHTISQLVGSFSLVVMAEKEPDKLVACRQGCPLIIGIGDQDNYISSDIHSIVSHTKKIIHLDDGDIGIISRDTAQIQNLDGDILEKEIQTISWDAEKAEKNGFPHYMLKEIYDQPTIARRILSHYINDDNDIIFPDLKIDKQELAQTSRLIIQACGTSFHAGLVSKYLFEKYARIPIEVDISSEFRYRHMILSQNEFVIALSQSGETADTLACMREAKNKFFKVLSFVNVRGSSIDRESDGVIYSLAGTEIGVASTKNYIAQLLSLYLFSLHLGHIKWSLSKAVLDDMIAQLKHIPDKIDQILEQSKKIEKIAKKYHKSRGFMFIGRGLNYPTALEGALKLKEISYIHATGYPAGELKHGPIALLDEDMPVVCLALRTSTYEKMVSNIEEVKARGAKTIIIASEGDTDIARLADDIIYIPACHEDHISILSVIPLQLLSYYIATALNCNVDQPRNLAKSVTVE